MQILQRITTPGPKACNFLRGSPLRTPKLANSKEDHHSGPQSLQIRKRITTPDPKACKSLKGSPLWTPNLTGCRQARWLVYTLFECGRPGVGPQNASVCVYEALTAPEAKKARPFEIIIPTDPKLASAWGHTLGARIQIQTPWVPNWTDGLMLSPVGSSQTMLGPMGPRGSIDSVNSRTRD